MPQFSPGEVRTAIAPIVAKPAGMNCEAELFLGPDDLTKIASSGRVPFVSTGAAKNISLPITMPTTQGTYKGYIDVLAEGLRFLAYKTTEDIQIMLPAVEIPKAYIRKVSPSVSEAYSGWIELSPIGTKLTLPDGRIQVGVLLRNPTQSPLRYTCTITNHHWIEPNNYTDQYLTLPSVEPVRFSPAPTGLPYSDYQYECDMFLPPGGELPAGKTGFVYTELFYSSLRWNYFYIEITCEGYNLGKTLLLQGWY